MTENQTVRTDIALDFHPDSLGNVAKDLEGDHPLGNKALAAAKEALDVAYKVNGAINDAEKQLRALASPDAPVYMHGSKLVKEHGGEEQLAKAAEQATQRALATIDRRVKEIESYRQVLTATVNAAIDHPERKTPVGIAESTEIRAHIKSLPENERFSFVASAITRGDTRTAAAVLHSPSYLSGLDQDTHGKLRMFAARGFAPTESRILDATSKALDKMSKGAASLVSRTAEVTGIAAQRAAKRAAALEKLAGVK
jgi:hypothetical protein